MLMDQVRHVTMPSLQPSSDRSSGVFFPRSSLTSRKSVVR